MKNEMEDFLKSFHQRNAGCTPAAFLFGKTLDGRTSYECIAESLLQSSSTTPAKVLDLACGDGILLQVLEQSARKNLTLVGVDMSAGELQAARDRLQGSNVQLFEGRAQNLPFESNSLDFIFCHMALMLMGELELVLAELRRCLKPGGTFSSVIGGAWITSPIMRQFSELLKEIMESEGAERIVLGDTRIRSLDESKILLQNFFEKVEVKDLEIFIEGSPEELMDFFMLTYQVDLLSEAGKKTLHERLLQKLKAQASHEHLRFSYVLRQITAVKEPS